MLAFSHKKKCLEDVFSHLASFFSCELSNWSFFCWQQKMLFASIIYHVDVAVIVPQIFTKSCQTKYMETNNDDTRNEQKEEVFRFSTDFIESAEPWIQAHIIINHERRSLTCHQKSGCTFQIIKTQYSFQLELYLSFRSSMSLLFDCHTRVSLSK